MAEEAAAVTTEPAAEAPAAAAKAAEATDATVTTGPAEENKDNANDAAPAAAPADAGAAGAGAGAEKAEEKKQIYNAPMPARIEVGNGYRFNRPLNFYVDRARRILRTEKSLEITGHGTIHGRGGVSKACTLVEVLKRQKIASIKAVSTGMETIPYFPKTRNGRGGDAQWSAPTTVIRFTLEQAEFASYVSDYHQRKVIEIFEKQDSDNDGMLSFEEIENLNLGAAFYANEEQLEEAAAFLQENGENKLLNLPNFIKYSSILIHPLLRDELFKEALSEKFGIVTGDSRGRPDEDE